MMSWRDGGRDKHTFFYLLNLYIALPRTGFPIPVLCKSHFHIANGLAEQTQFCSSIMHPSLHAETPAHQEEWENKNQIHRSLSSHKKQQNSKAGLTIIQVSPLPLAGYKTRNQIFPSSSADCRQKESSTKRRDSCPLCSISCKERMLFKRMGSCGKSNKHTPFSSSLWSPPNFDSLTYTFLWQE